MSWEVSTMPSKRSFFNLTLFRKNLGRFWPLWGGASLVGSLGPLYLLLAMLSEKSWKLAEAENFARGLYQAAELLVPGISFAYAALCAMLVWSYLFSPRAVGMMHTLPVTRTGLFVTNTLSGLTMALIPYVTVGSLTCLVALAGGVFPLAAVLQTVLTVICLTVLFFGIATLCAMVTGNLLALPVFYLLANFLSILLDGLASVQGQTVLVGVSGGSSAVMVWLSPLVHTYGVFHYYREWVSEDVLVQGLQGLGTVVIYGLMGLVLLAAAWQLYRLRRSESAGDVVAFRWLRPLFRLGVALLSALTLGWLLYLLLWAPFFQRGVYAEAVPMAVCMSLGGILGYYIASMLLEKSLRVFRGSGKGVLAVCALCAAFVLCLRFDVTGAERRVPELDKVVQINVKVGGSMPAFTLETEEEPELAERILDLHRAVVSDVGHIRAMSSGDDVDSIYLNLVYTLRDGSTLQRHYSLPLTRERAAEADTYDAKVLDLATDRSLLLRSKAIPSGYRLVGVDVSFTAVENADAAAAWLEGADARRVHEAMMEDLAAGRGPDELDTAEDFFNEEAGFTGPGAYAEFTEQDTSAQKTVDTVEILGYLRFGLVDVENGRSKGISQNVTADMTATLAALRELNALPAEILAGQTDFSK